MACVFINRNTKKFSKIKYLNGEQAEIDLEKGKISYDLVSIISSNDISLVNLKKSKYIIYFGVVRENKFFVISILTD